MKSSQRKLKSSALPCRASCVSRQFLCLSRSIAHSQDESAVDDMADSDMTPRHLFEMLDYTQGSSCDIAADRRHHIITKNLIRVYTYDICA